jgi:hypothetical protein
MEGRRLDLLRHSGLFFIAPEFLSRLTITSGPLAFLMTNNISSFTKDLRLSRCPSLLVLVPGPPSFTRRSSSSTKVSGRRTTVFGRRYRSHLGRTSSSEKISSLLFRKISPGSSKARPSTRTWLFLGRCALGQCCRFVRLTLLSQRGLVRTLLQHTTWLG